MSLFHSILSQLQQKIDKETTATVDIAAIVSVTLGTTIHKEQLILQGTTLRIKSTPTLKMAISLKREKILIALKAAGTTITTIQ
jgi:hypothetical protein